MNERLTYLPFPFPITTPVPMIAPLWVDFQFDTSGAVYSRVTYNPDTLNRVVKMITNLNPALSEYQPALAVIITWFEPRLHPLTSQTDSFPFGPNFVVSQLFFCKKNAIMFLQGTFQAVLSTDGSVTFAIFIYEVNQETIDNIQYYQVGFASGDGNAFINIVGREPAQYTGELQQISAFRIDGMTLTTATYS